MKNFFYKFFKSLVQIFLWPNTAYHILAITLTYFLVASGFDWYYFSVTRGISFNLLWMPAGLLGAFIPVMAPLFMYAFGSYAKKEKILYTASALAQSVILSMLTTSAYKFFTGRIPPNLSDAALDVSHGFRFGLGEGGIFWGWPSSHSAIAFSMAAVLWVLYSRNNKIKYGAFLYAAYIAFGASIGFHWFSEVISGIIIGILIGVTVGKSFKNRLGAQ